MDVWDLGEDAQRMEGSGGGGGGDAEEMYVAEAKVLRGAEHMAIDCGILVVVSGGGGIIMVVTRRRALIR